MGAAIPIMMFASAALTAVGQIQKSQAVAASERSQAAGLDFQTKILRDNAAAVMRESGARQDALARRQGLQIGRQGAAAGQSGFLASEGTLGSVLTQSAVEAELNLLNENYSGQMAARGLENQARLNNYESARLRANARAARTSGYLAAAGTGIQYGAGLANGSALSGTGYNPGDYGGSAFGGLARGGGL